MPPKEIEVFIRKNGWNWRFINQPAISVKRGTHFRYGSIELLCPRVTMYRE